MKKGPQTPQPFGAGPERCWHAFPKSFGGGARWPAVPPLHFSPLFVAIPFCNSSDCYSLQIAGFSFILSNFISSALYIQSIVGACACSVPSISPLLPPYPEGGRDSICIISASLAQEVAGQVPVNLWNLTLMCSPPRRHRHRSLTYFAASKSQS